MKLLRLLPRRARSVVALAVIFGAGNSLGAVGVMAVINATLRTGVYGPSLLALAFVGVLLLWIVSRIMAQVLLIRLAENTSAQLRRDLVQRILKARLRALEELGSHRLFALLTQDVRDITDALIQIPNLVMTVLLLVLSLAYLGWLSGQVVLAVLIGAVLGLLTYQLVQRWAIRAMRRARREQDDLYAHFTALTSGIKELKLHKPRRTAFSEQVLEPTIQAFQGYNITSRTLNSVAFSWSEGLMFAVIGVLFFVVPSIQRPDIATLASATIIVLHLFGALAYLMQIFPIFIGGTIALERIETLIPPPEATGTDMPLGSWHSLELVNVTHTYEHELLGSGFVMGPLDISFQPGELVFLVGGNGSGKTTLAKLLVGLYQPESGTVVLDGRPVTGANLEQYRQLFSVVFYDFYLFDRLLGLINSTPDDQTNFYLQRLQLDHKVAVRDGRLSTTDLSQGQRKRLALLTAYLEDRPFYVFDEWASDQDPAFKEVFYTQLLPDLKRRGKTILVISHDDKYFTVADRLIKIDYGKVDYDTSMTAPADAPALKRPALSPATHS